MEQLHLQFDEASSYQDPDAGRSVAAGATKESEAKRSISYVMDAVLQFGKVSGFADLLDRVATLCVTTGYSPFNALLMLLQRPAATYVLPAHQWNERYGFVIRPGEQPMVLLQLGGRDQHAPPRPAGDGACRRTRHQ